MINLEMLIEQANELAPLSGSAVRLAEMAADPECHIDELEEVIKYDQALTLKVLRAANSAASGSAVQIARVHDAVSRLGIGRVVAIAVAVGAKPFLQCTIRGYGLGEGMLWRHSVATAVAAELLPAFVNVEVPPETFTAALLHDVGKLVLGRFLSSEVLGFVQRAKEVNHLSQVEAETQLLQVHHGEVGGIIAQHWKLPPRLVLGITHHDAPQAGHDAICDFTYLANLVGKHVESALDGGTFEFEVLPEVAERVGLTPETLNQLCSLAGSRFEEISSRYNAI